MYIKIKDNLITNYRDFIYKKMDFKVNIMILLVSLFFTISVTIKLINNENMRYFMILSIILTYIITYMMS
jgi:glucose-6-phosphate-specific signal transduction histidine kinase